jgi:uncharacterized protein YjiS (DUF1127 family)
MAIDLRRQSPGRPIGWRRGGSLPRALGALNEAVTAVLRWREVRKQRRALLALSDHLLKDIGILRLDAIREASRPFWDTSLDGWRGWR